MIIQTNVDIPNSILNNSMCGGFFILKKTSM